MTGDGVPSPTPTRRRLLAGVGTALAAATAGCGYVPGGGDLAWEESIRTGGLAFADERFHLPAGDRLVTVTNQSGRTYDFEDEVWREVSNAAVSVLTSEGTVEAVGETARQVAGAPAVADDAVFLPLEGARLTAIDLPDAGSVAGGSSTDPVRWQVDIGSRLASESGGGEKSTDGRDETGPSLRAVRASDALAVAVGTRGIAAVDAETGDPRFAVPDLWAGADGAGGPGDAAQRVAVDAETAWAFAPGAASSAAVGTGPAIVGFDRRGDRRGERAVDAATEWLVALDGTAVAAAPGESLVGYDGGLDRRFALDVSVPERRPSGVVATEGRLYCARGRTLTAVDIAAGEIAFERSDLPSDHLAVDATGAYVAENSGGFNDPTRGRMVALGSGGSMRWEAPFPDEIEPRALFAIGGRLVAVERETAYAFRAAPGERWSPL